VGTFEHKGKLHEYCATADATYNESTSTLVVRLDCFARPVGLTVHEDHWYPDCLPKTRQQAEVVSRDDAVGEARDVFHSWVNRIRSAIAGQETRRKAIR
jgi:hypothetical protein